MMIATLGEAGTREGEELRVATFGGRLLEGELIGLRDDDLLLDTLHRAWMADIPRYEAGIVIVPFDSLNLTMIRGKSTYGKYALIGVVVGEGIGVAVGLANLPDFWEGFVAGCLGGLCSRTASHKCC
jgi:hypothetical protein